MEINCVPYSFLHNLSNSISEIGGYMECSNEVHDGKKRIILKE
jgi:hypothetical protein